MLRRTFGAGRGKLRGEWRKLYNEQLYDLYCLPNIIRLIKSRRMRGTGQVASMGGRTVHTGFWWRDLSEREHLQDPGLDGRIILKLILKKWDGEAWTGLIWLRIGTGVRRFSVL